MTTIQQLLDKEARLGNLAEQTPDLIAERKQVHAEIKVLRGGNPMPCWGEDDCSTMMLMRCRWRFDCGSEESFAWRREHR